MYTTGIKQRLLRFFTVLVSALIFIGIGLSVGCGPRWAEEIDRGSELTFREGHPDLRVLGSGIFDENEEPGIDLVVDVVKGSLIYRSSEGVFSASANITIDIFRTREREDDQLVLTESFLIEVSDENQDVVTSGDVFTKQIRLPVPPGRYEVVVGVQDLSSLNRSLSRTTVQIPDLAGGEIGLTNILLLGKDSNSGLDYQPVTTYLIPNRFDSLKFRYQVTRPEANGEMRIRMELRSFEADSLPARRIAGIPYPTNSIFFRGIEYGRSQVIEQIDRVLVSETGSILIEYATQTLPPGNYRFVAYIEKDGRRDELFRAREFFISGNPSFPYVQTIRDMAEPLIYLMDERRHREMMQIEDPEKLKEAIDRFWLTEMDNMNTAARVMGLYYERVEQANKQFSNFKEGWKTDAGMVYILFGPPMYVEHTTTRMDWFYSYMRFENPDRAFRFVKPRPTDRFFPFQHFVLQRSQRYHAIEYDQIQNWRTGFILQSGI